MTGTDFRLFRLNFVDRRELFDHPVVSDKDVTDVFETAADEQFDVVKRRPRNGYRWSIRDVHTDFADGSSRLVIAGVFSNELTYRTGPIVQPGGITYGTSAITPPMATTARFFIDVKRHLVAIQDVPAIMQSKTGWKNILQLILNTAAHSARFTSLVELEAIAPRQLVETRLKAFDRVTRLRVSLRVPNPDLGPTFQRLYDEMKDGGVRELTEDMRSERGLRMDTGSLPRMAVDMALSGYRKGDMRIYGVQNGRKAEFTLSDDVARISLREMRDYVEGMETATDKRGERRLMHAIIERIDETLDRLG